MKIQSALIAAVLASTAAACSSAVPEGGEGTEAKAENLVAPGNSTYFTLRPDLRRCAAPLCGGFFVKAVNVPNTRCADGSGKPECYVAELDLGALGLSAAQQAELRGRSREFLLRGAIRSKDFSPGGNLGVFAATEAWRGHEGIAPSGTFLRANNTGIVCITFPCPTMSAAVLNQNTAPFSVAALDLDGISNDPSDGFAELDEPEGLLLAAKRTVVTGPAGTAIGLDASEYYVPFEAKRQICGTRGAPACDKGTYCDFPQSANCGRADAPGVCAPRPIACTKQYDPVCGCDGQTYGNACMAAAAGVSVEHRGACEREERVCGTIVGLSCEEGEYCDFGAGQCLVSDAAGLCRARPQLCAEIFAPVCGCDGKTYENACVATIAGAQIDHDGSCK